MIQQQHTAAHGKYVREYDTWAHCIIHMASRCFNAQYGWAAILALN